VTIQCSNPALVMMKSVLGFNILLTKTEGFSSIFCDLTNFLCTVRGYRFVSSGSNPSLHSLTRQKECPTHTWADQQFVKNHRIMEVYFKWQDDCNSFWKLQEYIHDCIPIIQSQTLLLFYVHNLISHSCKPCTGIFLALMSLTHYKPNKPWSKFTFSEFIPVINDWLKAWPHFIFILKCFSTSFIPVELQVNITRVSSTQRVTGLITKFKITQNLTFQRV
jgi:hypothetical protein